MSEDPNREIHAAAIAFLENLAAGKCPVCGNVPNRYVQRGRCVYGDPCGHRMWQGSAKEWNKMKEERQVKLGYYTTIDKQNIVQITQHGELTWRGVISTLDGQSLDFVHYNDQGEVQARADEHFRQQKRLDLSTWSEKNPQE